MSSADKIDSSPASVVLQMLRTGADEGVTVESISAACGQTTGAVNDVLALLVSEGRAETNGERWRVAIGLSPNATTSLGPAGVAVLGSLRTAGDEGTSVEEIASTHNQSNAAVLDILMPLSWMGRAESNGSKWRLQVSTASTQVESRPVGVDKPDVRVMWTAVALLLLGSLLPWAVIEDRFSGARYQSVNAFSAVHVEEPFTGEPIRQAFAGGLGVGVFILFTALTLGIMAVRGLNGGGMRLAAILFLLLLGLLMLVQIPAFLLLESNLSGGGTLPLPSFGWFVTGAGIIVGLVGVVRFGRR